MIWRPIHERGMMRLDQQFELWSRTPYRDGPAVPGRQMNCIQVLTAITDQMYRRPQREYRTIPNDACLHKPATAWKALRLIRSWYNCVTVRDGTIEPGDWLVTDIAEKSGPGHGIMAGTRANEFWEADIQVGFINTSLSQLRSRRIFRVYRGMGRESW